jgi:hypothetical protein
MDDKMHSGTVIDPAANNLLADMPKADDDRQCTQMKPDGDRCREQALTGSSLCFFHDPAQGSARAAASRRGGEKTRAAVLSRETPDAPLSTAAEVTAFLGRTINQIMRGQLDPKIGTTVGYLLTVMIKAGDLGKLDQRVATLERALKETEIDASVFESDIFGEA